ncbi:MAG TPA: hypothetical protein VER55_05445 [Ardenticatenaceae bacterium]|nr:hypothetical protein [Ardenticatenaceae bacterium]
MFRRINRLLWPAIGTLVAAIRWLRFAAPLLVVGAAAGALAGLAISVTQPRQFAAQAIVSLEPEVFEQNTVLSMQGLVNNYALQLQSDELVASALQVARPAGSGVTVAPTVTAWADEVDLTITVRVLASRPEEAVALVRALQEQFTRQLEAANRRQARESRLRVVVLEPAWDAVQISPRHRSLGLRGGAAGLAVAVAFALARTWRRRTTFSRPIDVERLLGSPILGTIPRGR